MSLGNALATLTFLPIPFRRQIPLAQSLHFFPLVGAALGSLTVLAYLGTLRYFPEALSCLVAVVLPEALGGWKFLRGVSEFKAGRRTDFGAEFDSPSKPGLQGFAIMAAVIFLKTSILFLLPLEWRIRAVFVIPILGRCAFTLAAILGRFSESKSGKFLDNRRSIRAGMLCILLLMLLFQFPWRISLASMALFSIVTFGGTQWVISGGRRSFQALCVVAEAVELSLLACLAAAFWMLART